MPDRFWVGGSGTWSSTNTTNWSATSGGGGGASVPTSADSVFFNQAGTYTVTLAGAGQSICLNITVSAGTVTFAGSGVAIHGSMTLSASTVWSSTSGIQFSQTSATTRTITTNGVTFSANFILNAGSTSTWNLGSALTTSGQLIVDGGTFNTTASNFSVSCAVVDVRSGATATLNASTITITAPNGWIANSASTINAGTSTINLTASNAAHDGGGKTYRNVSFTSTAISGARITGANSYTNLTIAGRTGANQGVGVFTFDNNQTITGTFTVSPGTNATFRIRLASSNSDYTRNGTARTLTCAAVSLTDVDFADITGAGAASPFSGTRLGNVINNTNITFLVKTVYWNLAGNSDVMSAGWALTSGGTPAVNNFPLAQDTMVIDNSSAGAQLTFVGAATRRYTYGTFNASLRTTAFTVVLGSDGDTWLFGDWTSGTGLTLNTGGSAAAFIGTRAKTLTSNGVAFGGSITINTEGSLTLQGALTTTTIFFVQGTWNLNNFNVTISNFLNASYTFPKTLNLGSSTITIAGSSFSAVAAGFNVTGTGTISMTGATAKTFAGGGANFGSVKLNQGAAGVLTITGSNTFGDITNSYKTIGATTITFTAGTTTTVSDFTASGESGRVLTINSTSAGSAATLSKASGTVNADFLNISDSTATGGATWNATNSTNGGNNSGWNFIAAATGNFFMFF